MSEPGTPKRLIEGAFSPQEVSAESAREKSVAQVHPIQDPASKLQPDPQAQIVRYRVRRDDRRQADTA
jgi:hypothetical protein